MAFTTLRYFVAAALLVACTLACAQLQGDSAAAVSDGPSAFELQIQAPPTISELLQRHLELQRYRVLADLSDAEIQTLLLSARQDASNLLATLGFFSADIQIDLQPAQALSGRIVRIKVEPGPQARVGVVRLVVEGAIAESNAAQEQRQSVQDLWSLPTGEPFTQSAWDAAKEQALRLLLTRRFAAARLTQSSADVHPESASVDLEVHLDSGPAYAIGSLQVQGDKRYGSDLVQRFARLRAGEDYVQSELAEAQQRLTGSGYYDSAYLSLDLSSDPRQAVVRTQVQESSMQKIVLGIGASTDTGARWSAEHTYNQVPGIDWRAVNKITAARDTSTFSSDWTSQPGDSHWRWAASALFQQDNVGEIDVGTQRYRAGRFTTEVDFDQSYYLQFERAEARFREIDQRIANEAASANYAFALRHFDSTPFPSSGWGLGGELAVGSVMGSDQEPFARALFRWRAYQPLGQSQSNLFSRQHAGRMVYRAQTGAVLVNNAVNIPFNQLFLTGGDNTVRGYKHEEIGVTHDGVLSAEGGRYLVTGGVEWQRPIVRDGLLTDWESAVFIDTGAVANRVEEFSLKVGLGVGARWKSPIGPLQVDAAYGVATKAFRLHLNVGFVF